MTGPQAAHAETLEELSEEERQAEEESRAVLAGVTSEHGLAGDREKTADRQRELANNLAALTVRRLTNQHGCPGKGCRHEDHRRDVDYCRAMLATLGLPGGYPAVAAEDRAEFVGSVAERLPRQGGKRGNPEKKPRWNQTLSRE